MTSNNISMKDTRYGVVVQADGRTLPAKLVFAGSARLAECDLGIEELRAAFKKAHGEESSKGTLTYQLNENDEDALQPSTTPTSRWPRSTAPSRSRSRPP